MDKKIEQYLDGHDVTLRLESTSELVAIHSDDERIYVMKESYHALASALLSMNVEDKEQEQELYNVANDIGNIATSNTVGDDWEFDRTSFIEELTQSFYLIKKPQ